MVEQVLSKELTGEIEKAALLVSDMFLAGKVLVGVRNGSITLDDKGKVTVIEGDTSVLVGSHTEQLLQQQRAHYYHGDAERDGALKMMTKNTKERLEKGETEAGILQKLREEFTPTITQEIKTLNEKALASMEERRKAAEPDKTPKAGQQVLSEKLTGSIKQFAEKSGNLGITVYVMEGVENGSIKLDDKGDVNFVRGEGSGSVTNQHAQMLIELQRQSFIDAASKSITEGAHKKLALGVAEEKLIKEYDQLSIDINPEIKRLQAETITSMNERRAAEAAKAKEKPEPIAATKPAEKKPTTAKDWGLDRDGSGRVSGEEAGNFADSITEKLAALNHKNPALAAAARKALEKVDANQDGKFDAQDVTQMKKSVGGAYDKLNLDRITKKLAGGAIRFDGDTDGPAGSPLSNQGKIQTTDGKHH